MIHAPLSTIPALDSTDCSGKMSKGVCETSILSMSSNVSMNNYTLSELCSNDNNTDPLNILKQLKICNLNRLVIGQLNINSIRNKFESLKLLVKGNIDIMVITESKLDSTFPSEQFAIEGYNLPY